MPKWVTKMCWVWWMFSMPGFIGAGYGLCSDAVERYGGGHLIRDPQKPFFSDLARVHAEKYGRLMGMSSVDQWMGAAVDAAEVPAATARDYATKDGGTVRFIPERHELVLSYDGKVVLYYRVEPHLESRLRLSGDAFARRFAAAVTRGQSLDHGSGFKVASLAMHCERHAREFGLRANDPGACAEYARRAAAFARKAGGKTLCFETVDEVGPTLIKFAIDTGEILVMNETTRATRTYFVADPMKVQRFGVMSDFEYVLLSLTATGRGQN
jgi:hypothetical protein